MEHSKVVFISNDFGFGPLSRTYVIAKALCKINPDLEIHIATNGKSDYLFNSSSIIFDRLDDLRDRSVISKYLKQFNAGETLLISTMNRFALLVSRNLGLTTILIDGLYWFWINRPEEYDLADYQFRMVLPWQTDQYKGSKKIFYFANPVDATMDKDDTRHSRGKRVLFTLNGFVTPFYKQEHNSYLAFSALVANQLSKNNKVLLTGNKGIKEEISKHLDAAVNFETLDKAEYIHELGASKYVLLNGGSNSFLEALVHRKRFIFSLPSNQSQYALIKKISEYTNSTIVDWCPLLKLFPNHERILQFDNESNAIDFWSEQIRLQLKNKGIINHMDKLLGILPAELSKLDSQSLKLENHAYKSVESANEIAKAINRLAK